ncbi:TlpA disulfide reductase family protein [soil metagenome]
MITKRITIKALAAFTLFTGFGLVAKAVPPMQKVEEMAKVMPKQAGVDVAVLSPADLARCRVEPFPNAQAPVGYVLFDGNNRPVRRFVANGTPNFNILSFYNEGEEVYRETDSKNAGKIDHYRWLGSNGGKIGRDVDGNGTIDVWDSISAEEVTKELFEAVAAKDVEKFKALLVTDAELKALGLPAVEIAKYTARTTAAVAKFSATGTDAKLTKAAKWIHAEFFVPRTTPADAFGGTQDLVKHPSAGVMFDKGDNKTADFISTGEMIRVGTAWRLIDGPSLGSPQAPQIGVTQGDGDVPEEIKTLVQQLVQLKDPGVPGAESIKYHQARAAILEQIVAKMNGKPGQETWLRQLIDAYSAAADQGDKPATEKLLAWKTQIEKFAPRTPIAGYAGFRALGVEYAVKLKESDTAVKVAAVQTWWRTELENFVKAYPGSEETPEALYRLGMATEFNGKDGEAAAMGHYTALAKNFPAHPLAAQATGAARRLDSEGKAFVLAGADLATGKEFNAAGLTGKVVVVYFWGSFALQSGNLKQDAAFLADLAKKHGDKLAIVTVTLDQNPQAAVPAINASQLPGTHLFSANGAMATAYGIMGQHLFLIGKDGKVVNKSSSIPAIGDEVEKLVK